MEELTEIQKKAWIDREMSQRDDCDVIIKKRDGMIVYSVIKPIIPEIRAEFSILFNEKNPV